MAAATPSAKESKGAFSYLAGFAFGAGIFAVGTAAFSIGLGIFALMHTAAVETALASMHVVIDTAIASGLLALGVPLVAGALLMAGGAFLMTKKVISFLNERSAAKENIPKQKAQAPFSRAFTASVSALKVGKKRLFNRVARVSRTPASSSASAALKPSQI